MGQEKDPETGWETFELRIACPETSGYNGRVGRWMTTDPYSQYHSPYLAMGNNPISRIDPDGGTDGEYKPLPILDFNFAFFTPGPNGDQIRKEVSAKVGIVLLQNVMNLADDNLETYNLGYGTPDYEAVYVNLILPLKYQKINPMVDKERKVITDVELLLPHIKPGYSSCSIPGVVITYIPGPSHVKNEGRYLMFTQEGTTKQIGINSTAYTLRALDDGRGRRTILIIEFHGESKELLLEYQSDMKRAYMELEIARIRAKIKTDGTYRRQSPEVIEKRIELLKKAYKIR